MDLSMKKGKYNKQQMFNFLFKKAETNFLIFEMSFIMKLKHIKY